MIGVIINLVFLIVLYHHTLRPAVFIVFIRESGDLVMVFIIYIFWNNQEVQSRARINFLMKIRSVPVSIIKISMCLLKAVIFVMFSLCTGTGNLVLSDEKCRLQSHFDTVQCMGHQEDLEIKINSLGQFPPGLTITIHKDGYNHSYFVN